MDHLSYFKFVIALLPLKTKFIVFEYRDCRNTDIYIYTEYGVKIENNVSSRFQFLERRVVSITLYKI